MKVSRNRSEKTVSGYKTMESKLVLGTIQLGMAYGINNQSGQPDKNDAFSILDLAFTNGITTFDTARAYGASEEILGEWIQERGIADSVNVITKMRPGASDVRQELHASLKALHTKKLDSYMLHAAKDMYTDGIVDEMMTLKEEGVAHVGVSIYEPQEALDAAERGFECIQVPYNVFDRRLDMNDFFAIAKKKRMTVFARSPFLQGLLLMEPDVLPVHLSHARPYLEQFRAIAFDYGMSPLQAAFAYVNAHHGIDHIVFGVETPAQLEEILGLANKERNEECMQELKTAFAIVDETIVNPVLWKKR